VRGTLFDPAVSGLSGCYPTGQGVTPFEVHWTPCERTRAGVIQVGSATLPIPHRNF
jgi:hypothetical protein